MLDKIGFSPSRDHLVVLGDLVNRGPKSLATLQRLRALGDSATCLLGNHDLHLLAVAHGVRKLHRGDTFGDMLESQRRGEWLDWLRHRRLAQQRCGWLLVHAGVVPQWDAATTLALAAEVEAVLRGETLADFLPQMYGNQPARWDESLQGAGPMAVHRQRADAHPLLQRRRRARSEDEGRRAGARRRGTSRGSTSPGGAARRTPIAFGHWSTLGLINRPDLLALDTGCVWGGALSAVRIDGGRRELIQVDCEAAQQPG